MENYTITELEKFTITQLEATFAARNIESYLTDIFRFFFFDDTDYKQYLHSVSSITRDAKNIVASNVNIDLINTNKTWNKLYNDPGTNLTKSIALKLGLPAKQIIFSGYGDDVDCRTIATLTARDRMQDVFDKTVGDTNTPVTTGDNLIANPGMEDWTNGDLDDWTESGNVVKETTEKHGGSNSTELVKEDATDDYIYQGSLAVDADRCYAFTFWHKSDTASKLAGYSVYDDNNKYLQADLTWHTDAYEFTQASLTTGWTKASVVFLVDSDASTLTVKITNVGAANYKLWVDDAYLGDGNPACLAFNILTIYGGLSNTFSTSNTEIYFTNWDTWFNNCESVELLLEGNFTGENIKSVMRQIADYSSSYIFVNNDWLVDFSRLLPAASGNSYSFTEILKEPETQIDKSELVNNLRVWYGYDRTDWDSGGSVQTTRTDSISTWGTYANEVKNTTIWHANATSAIVHRDKHLTLYQEPQKFITTTLPLIGLREDLANHIDLTVPTLELTASPHRVVKIINDVFMKGEIKLQCKDLATESQLFLIDTEADWDAGAHTNTEATTTPGILQTLRSEGTYTNQDTDNTEYAWSGGIYVERGSSEIITVAQGQTESYTSVQIKTTAGGEAQIKLVLADENDIEKDSWERHTSSTNYVTKTHTFTLSDYFSVGDKFKIRRYIGNGVYPKTTYTDTFAVQLEDFKAAASYISVTKNFEAEVTYNEVKVVCELNGQSGTLYVDGDDNDAFASAATFTQALQEGTNTYDITVLGSEQYCRVRVALVSDGDDTVEVDSVLVTIS